MAVLWTKHSRILFCEPPPQVTEHSDQSVQGVKDGQVSSLHFSIISESPSEHLKASDLGKTHSLAFFRSPPPQLLVQGVQSVHSVQTGQGLSLQVSVSILRKKKNQNHWIEHERGYTSKLKSISLKWTKSLRHIRTMIVRPSPLVDWTKSLPQMLQHINFKIQVRIFDWSDKKQCYQLVMG